MSNLNKSEIASFVEKFTMGSMLDSKKKSRENLYYADRPQSSQNFALQDNVVLSLRTIGL
jgi:hypothetical protein